MSCQNDPETESEETTSENVEVETSVEQDQLINENLIDTAEVVKKIEALVENSENKYDQLFRINVNFMGYEEMVDIMSYFDSTGTLLYYEEEYGNTSGVGRYIMFFDKEEPIALLETSETPSGDESTKTYSHKDFTPFSGFSTTWTEKGDSTTREVKYIGAKKLKEWGYQTLATVKRQKVKISGYINSPKGAELEGESMDFSFVKTDSTMPGMPVKITTSYHFDRWLFKDLFKK